MVQLLAIDQDLVQDPEVDQEVHKALENHVHVQGKLKFILIIDIM
jgi:hypothetical protein